MANYGNWFENATKVLSNKIPLSIVQKVDTETIDLSYNVNTISGVSTVTLPSGTYDGQTVRIINVGTGTCIVQGDFAVSNNTLTMLSSSGGVELVWGATSTGTGWGMVGTADGTKIALSVV